MLISSVTKYFIVCKILAQTLLHFSLTITMKMRLGTFKCPPFTDWKTEVPPVQDKAAKGDNEASPGW